MIGTESEIVGIVIFAVVILAFLLAQHVIDRHAKKSEKHEVRDPSGSILAVFFDDGHGYVESTRSFTITVRCERGIDPTAETWTKVLKSAERFGHVSRSNRLVVIKDGLEIGRIEPMADCEEG